MNKDVPKTLLFSVSASDCFKNFLAFPNSVFELLGNDVDDGVVRLVFVVPEEKTFLRETLDAYVREHPSVAVEYVRVAPRRGLERPLAFFYSYFVYSGTTRTLATMSMRLGEAPGGGKRWLAPLKWLIANTFGRVRFLSEPLVEFLYELLFPRPFFDLFSKYKPDLVFTPNLHDRFDQEVSREAKLRHVERIGMVLNWDHWDKYYLPFVPERLLAQSEQLKDFAIRYQGKNAERIEITGYPFLDHLVRPEHTLAREKVLDDLGFPRDAQYILYVAGSMYSPDEPDIIEQMLAWAETKEIGENVYFVIRPYPGGRGKDEAFDQKKFEGFAKHPRVSFQMQKFWAGFETNVAFMNIVRHAGVVLAVYSTAVLPSVAMNRPTMTFMFDGYKERPYHRSIKRFALREHYRDALTTGGQASAYDFDDLKNKLKTFLAHPETDDDKRAVMRPRVVGPLDGGASRRIYQALRSEL